MSQNSELRPKEMSHRLEFRLLGPSDEPHVGTFLEDIAEDEDASQFRPHEMTRAKAADICHHRGDDVYAGAFAGTVVAAYGMLRGWDEGYDVPSLGIAVHRDFRGKGLATAFMFYLHAFARIRGARKVRLRVHPQNTVACKLYESCGYSKMSELERGQIVFVCDL